MFVNKALLPAVALAGASLAQTTVITATATATATSDSNAECTQSYVSLLLGAPTPDAALGSAITSYASSLASASGTSAINGADPLAVVTQVCDFSSGLPTSLQSDFDAYVTQVISYVSASSSAIDAVITNCVVTGAEGATYASLVNSFAAQTGPLCQATGAPGGGSNNGSTTIGGGGSPTPTTSGEGSGQTSPPPTNAGAHPAVFGGAAAAAAGLLGAAILL
ncbi:hypothetical protein SAMD00023353_0802460 [Rosellinia necatrix]|uniref:DUF7735 domain-containing protein n=1 Tax=Rosellinia necatrix TaxID=77044 RepID=A0A1W2TBA5_ROSNE|nr:hypothetical protein SAMD00023353_0802460 [Rosellinia necatrix]